MPSTPFSRSCPAFVIGEYAEGELIELPWSCPQCEAGVPCDVVLHGLRDRKCGPGHALAVARCHAHGLSFTVYPPGFVPYARRALLEVPGAESPPPAALPSMATVAADAAAGVAWPRGAAEEGRCWSTQGRVLTRLGRVVGASAEASDREFMAVALGLPLHLLWEVSEATGYRARGRALTEVVAILGLDGLLLAGALTGCWGPPWRWQRAPARLVPLVPAHLWQAAKASTTLGHGVCPPFT